MSTRHPIQYITKNLTPSENSENLNNRLSALRAQEAINQTDCNKHPEDPDCITLNEMVEGGKSRRRRHKRSKKSRSNKKRKTFRKKRVHH